MGFIDWLRSNSWVKGQIVCFLSVVAKITALKHARFGAKFSPKPGYT